MMESNKFDQIHLFMVVICSTLEKYDLETSSWCCDMVNLNAFKIINHKMNIDEPGYVLASALALGVRVLAMFLGDVILVLQILVRVVFKTLVFSWVGFLRAPQHHLQDYDHGNCVLHGFKCLSVVHQPQPWNKKL